ncbi:MAG: hypothetical protein JST39_16760, partial [Bacteroidetes bacterium]|nr:hypothetical protein [Bacteroidota bacterium]
KQFSRVSTTTTDDGKTKNELIDATGKDGKTYTLRSLNNEVTFLSIDGQEIPREKYPEYKDIINALHGGRDANHEKRMNLFNKHSSFLTNPADKKWSAEKTEWKKDSYATNKLFKLKSDNALTYQKIELKNYEFVEKKGDANSSYQAKSLELQKTKTLAIPYAKKPTYASEEPADLQRQKDLLRAMVDELVSDGILRSRGRLVSLGLTDNEFVINAQKQPEAVRQKYRARFLARPGLGLFYGPIQLTGKGYFFNKEDLAN